VEDEDDGLYNLAGLAEDEELDDAATGDEVPSLDEEFSRQALLAGELVDGEPDVAAAVPVAAPLTALSSIAALRRPAMTHSVAVIVARGADF